MERLEKKLSMAILTTIILSGDGLTVNAEESGKNTSENWRTSSKRAKQALRILCMQKSFNGDCLLLCGRKRLLRELST